MDQFHLNDPLLIAGKAICILMQIFAGIAAVSLAIATIALLIFGGDLAAEVSKEFSGPAGDLPLAAIVGMMAIGLAVVAAMFVFFGKLRQIIQTVSEGDPFVPQNAERLNFMAWLLLALHVLMLPATALGVFIAKWADQIENATFSMDFGIDLEGILMVIVLFILARVFKHGAAMREDLEGTV